ncbi:protein argonaute-2-like isoform X2 [Panulirus ornatus]|uniref:protein argonaute-2-like isoform X2 n=1 Tax=Panulirus ornatus TaxID=150431 RepID=UPI003A896F6A
MVWKEMQDDPHLPTRKDVGTLGRKISLTANFFEVTVSDEHVWLYHYDVVINELNRQESLMPKKKRMKIFENMKKSYRQFKNFPLAFDSEKNAYSVNLIPKFKKKTGNKYEVDITQESGRKEKFLVTLTVVNEASLHTLLSAIRGQPGQKRDVPQFIIQMVEVMFQHNLSIRYERVGRTSFFSMDGEFGASYDIGCGKEAMMGFFGSLRPASWKNGSLLLNIDVANAAFYKEQSVLDFIKETLRLRDQELRQALEPTKKRKLEKELKSIKFCKIAKGQKVTKKLSDAETSQFIRKTAKLPAQRIGITRHIVHQQNFSNDSMMKSLQFSISDRPVELSGRVLPPPRLLMNEELVPNKGIWDARERNFFVAATLTQWAIFNYDARIISADILRRFVGSLIRMGQERGMTIGFPVMKNFQHPNPEGDLPEIKSQFPNIEMIMVVLPRFGNYYGRVKKIGDQQVGIVTQCIKSDNVEKNAPPTVGNLLLKINAKLGGTNNVLGSSSRPFVFNAPVMIMGADVNHPPAGDTVTPSLAAVVASLDRYACKYAVEVRHQKHRTEMIKELKEMTKNLLRGFYTATKRKPQRIIMYRDGVSESQFQEVLSYELKAMRMACTELEAEYKPAMTFLVVQKRHHTRLFCQERDGVGKSKNIPPGTTVDTDIIHPSERDFYLCSHQGIQGTSKPTHYHVLWDDSDFSMDLLQTLTYSMCHLYSRCTRSVSIPAPAYYAHLVAFRAKVHIHDICSSDTSSVESGEERALNDAIMTRAVKMDRENVMSSRLYFV